MQAVEEAFRPPALSPVPGLAASATPRRRRRTTPPSGTGRSSGRSPRPDARAPAATPRAGRRTSCRRGTPREDQQVLQRVRNRSLMSLVNRLRVVLEPDEAPTQGVVLVGQGQVDVPADQPVDEDAEQDQRGGEQQQARSPVPRVAHGRHSRVVSEHVFGVTDGRAPGWAARRGGVPPRPASVADQLLGELLPPRRPAPSAAPPTSWSAENLRRPRSWPRPASPASTAAPWAQRRRRSCPCQSAIAACWYGG